MGLNMTYDGYIAAAPLARWVVVDRDLNLDGKKLRQHANLDSARQKLKSLKPTSVHPNLILIRSNQPGEQTGGAAPLARLEEIEEKGPMLCLMRTTEIDNPFRLTLPRNSICD
jgi:hypothetical protein